MVIEVKPHKDESSDIEEKTKKIFFKTIELLGGIRKLAEYRSLTWLPALARASYVVVLKEDFFKTDEEIAKIVGVTKNTVKVILQSSPEIALKKIKDLEEGIEKAEKELKIHIAGAIARLAHKELKETTSGQ